MRCELRMYLGQGEDVVARGRSLGSTSVAPPNNSPQCQSHSPRLKPATPSILWPIYSIHPPLSLPHWTALYPLSTFLLDVASWSKWTPPFGNPPDGTREPVVGERRVGDLRPELRMVGQQSLAVGRFVLTCLRQRDRSMQAHAASSAAGKSCTQPR